MLPAGIVVATKEAYLRKGAIDCVSLTNCKSSSEANIKISKGNYQKLKHFFVKHLKI